MVESGADIGVYGKSFCPIIADLTFAQLRRFTEYNQKFAPSSTENDAFCTLTVNGVSVYDKPTKRSYSEDFIAEEL